MKSNKIWKRIVAIALAGVLVIPVSREMGRSAGEVIAASLNLVTNGDFDADGSVMDVTGWTPGAATAEKEAIELFPDGTFDNGAVFTVVPGSAEGTIEVATEDSNKVLSITTTSGSSYTIGKGGLAAVAGTEYTISFRAKPVSTSGTAILGTVLIERGAGTNGGALSTKAGEEKSTDFDGWKTITYQVTAASGTTSWDLRFTSNTNAATWYIDDVAITTEGTEDIEVEVNAAENGTFDEDLSGWQVSAGNAVWYEVDDTGVMKYEPAARDDYIRCYVPVEGGKTYTFSYRFKGSDGSAARLLPLIINRKADKTTKVPDSTDSNYTSMDPRQPGTAWKTAASTFTAAEGAEIAEFRLRISNGTDIIYFDDFTFISKEKVYGDGIILNGSDYKMKLSDGNKAVYEGTSLDAGEWYEYSYDVSKEGSLTAGFQVGETVFSETVGSFKYEADQTLGFATEGTGTAYFDNLVVKVHADHTDVNEDEYCDVCHKYVVREMISNGNFTVTDGIWNGWETGAIPVGEAGPNLLANGGFETEGTTNLGTKDWWVRQGETTKATLVEIEGSKVLKMQWNTGDAKELQVAMNYYETLAANTKYIVRFKMKTIDENMNMKPTAIVKRNSVTNFPVLSESPITTTENDWKLFELSYTTPEDLKDNQNFLLYFDLSKNPATVYIDDVQIYKAPIKNDVSVEASSVAGIDGVTITNNGVYVQTVTKNTQEDSTYILTMNTAKTGDGDVKLLVNQGSENTALVDSMMDCNTEVTGQKYLITPKEAANCTVRFQVCADATSLSVGNVSMYKNRGDFDEDGDINDTDFATMRNVLVGKTVDNAASFSDLTADAVTSSQDLVRIKLYAAGIK